MSDVWFQEDIIEESEDVTVNEYDITATPNDFNISTIFSLIDNGVIKMPPFQRNYVWDEKRASKLIESIILGLPIPQVFLYEQGKNSFFVIDGQQRLLSIYFFMKQRFPTKDGKTILRGYFTGDIKIDESILSDDKYFKNFKLKLPAQASGEKNKFNGLKYEMLEEYKYTFDILRTIRSVIIKQNAPNDDSSIYEIFNRLNTGGQNLSPQEIRMSVYYSEFYKRIIEANNNVLWRKILNQPTIDIHFKDIEILLRAFAMLFYHETYRSPMGKFLNTFSKRANSFDEETIDYLMNLLNSFFESCSELPNDAFLSSTGQFRISLFEAVFVAACIEKFNNKELIEKKINKDSVAELKVNKELVEATQGSVASKSSVDIRMRAAKNILRFE